MKNSKSINELSMFSANNVQIYVNTCYAKIVAMLVLASYELLGKRSLAALKSMQLYDVSLAICGKC